MTIGIPTRHSSAETSTRVMTILALLAVSCGTTATVHPPTDPPAADAAPSEVTEVRVRQLPLSLPPEVQKELELSGLAWDLKRDRLVALSEKEGKGLVAFSRADLAAAIDGNRQPVEHERITLVVKDQERIPYFDGYEAIAFRGDEVWITVETEPENDNTAYLLHGHVMPGGAQIEVTFDPARRLPTQAQVDNLSYEALVSTPSGVLAFYEANGHPKRTLNDRVEWLRTSGPATWIWNNEGGERLSMPPIEYRLTDATDLSGGRFWMINYQYSGDLELRAADEPIATAFGRGPTHARSAKDVSEMVVERILSFELDPMTGDPVLTSDAPIQIDLERFADGSKRAGTGGNWEGIVRWDDPEGFLLVADKYGPEPNKLVFLELPEVRSASGS